MRGNTFGKLFSITTFGESHGEAIGVVVDGMPSNIEISMDDLKMELKRRAPGGGSTTGTTDRIEADEPIVLSGIFEGKTLGSPIAIMIKNTNQKSDDYQKLKDIFRPGHADQTTMLKYGIRDHRGGGRASGRETAARVVGGYFAGLILPSLKITSTISRISGQNNFNKKSKYDIKSPEFISFLNKLKEEGNSVGAEVEIQVNQVPVGLGEPAFNKLKADLAQAVLSIGGVVGFSFGLGFDILDFDGHTIQNVDNPYGGIEGGISNGREIFLKVAVKPTSTVKENAKMGRHDPCIAIRAIPVLEAMVKMCIADHFLRQNAYRV